MSEALRKVVARPCELDTHIIGPSLRTQMMVPVNTGQVSAKKQLHRKKRETETNKKASGSTYEWPCKGISSAVAPVTLNRKELDRSHNCWHCAIPEYKVKICCPNQECSLCAEDGNISHLTIEAWRFGLCKMLVLLEGACSGKETQGLLDARMTKRVINKLFLVYPPRTARTIKVPLASTSSSLRRI